MKINIIQNVEGWSVVPNPLPCKIHKVTYLKDTFEQRSGHDRTLTYDIFSN